MPRVRTAGHGGGELLHHVWGDPALGRHSSEALSLSLQLALRGKRQPASEAAARIRSSSLHPEQQPASETADREGKGTPVSETIAAISTPPGRGGIGIVRLSGNAARSIAEAIVLADGPLQPGRARFVSLLDPEASRAHGPARVLDEAVVTYFAGPRSYTGEDVVEIAAHGSPVVLEAILREMLRQGARLAEPGEFTQRAFLAGRLDLTQAEAVHDLIAATTLHQARVAATQMGGSISVVIGPIKQQLIELIASMEAAIDFAEDDLDIAPEKALAATIQRILEPLSRLAASFAYGRTLREGFTLAIVGRPNAGKSSLFNALLERDRAIVTATPGTTRDAISESLSFDGIPVQLTDTAGLREAADEVELLGIARTRTVLAEAALAILVIDLTQGLHAEDLALLAREASLASTPKEGMRSNVRRLLVVANKTDVFSTAPALAAALARLGLGDEYPVIPVSALAATGLPALRATIRDALAGELPDQDTAVITSLRQHAALTTASIGLTAAQDALRASVPSEMVVLDLRTALEALDGLTGITTADDILGTIFSTFCIGK